MTLPNISVLLHRHVWLLLSGIMAVGALPLDFCGKLRILRASLKHAALHDVEASLSHIRLLFGPAGSDPTFCVVWFRFTLIGGCLGLLVNLVKLLGSIVCCIMFLMTVSDMGLLICLLHVRASLVSIGTLMLTVGKDLGFLV